MSENSKSVTDRGDACYKEIATEKYFAMIRAKLELTGRASIRITGFSMNPFLVKERDTADIIPYTSRLKRGDITLCEVRPGVFILHRVTKIEPDRFSMRGDNTVRGETGLLFSQIIGLVVAVSRNGRHIARGSLIWRWYYLVGRINRFGRFLWVGQLKPAIKKIIGRK